MKIAPSILDADFARLGEQIAAAEQAGADQIHVDVMDGHFVPNLSMGPAVVESIRRITQLPIDVHLMVAQPDRFLDAFATAGANALTFHVELGEGTSRTIEAIRALGLRAGLAIKPATNLEDLRPFLAALDIILILSVEPGFGGQTFLTPSVDRISRMRDMLDHVESKADLSIDGGIDAITGKQAVKAGATVLVAGHAIFHDERGVTVAIHTLRDAARG